jgi:hypothetical protein
MPAGIAGMAMPERSALEDSAEERQQQVYEAAGAGHHGVHPASTRTCSPTPRQRHRSRIRAARSARSSRTLQWPRNSRRRDHFDRHQAHLPRHRLFRDLQPRQRHAGRRAQRADRIDHRREACAPPSANSARCDRHRHRLRRDDRAAAGIDMRTGAGATLPRSGPVGRAPISA